MTAGKATRGAGRARQVFRILGALAAMIGTVFAPPATAQDWRPQRVTILLGHTLEGRDGQLARALAAAWSRTLGAPMVVEARGRESALAAASEFARRPRDGTVVLAGDLGELAIAYARRRPSWMWDRTLDHLAVYGRDPAILVAPAPTDADTLARVVAGMRADTVPVAVARWLSLESLLLADAGVQTGARIQPVPVGAGASLAAAVTESGLPYALARRSDAVAHKKRLSILAGAAPLAGEGEDGLARLDDAFGAPMVPAGAIAAVSVHADLQRVFPERHDRLARSLAAARADGRFRDALGRLGLAAPDDPGPAPDAILAAVRQWWDAWHRAGHLLAAAPPPLVARARITALADGGRTIRYLGLDGRIHVVRADPDATEIAVGGVGAGGPDPLAALRVGMLCEIAWPAAAASEAVRVSCK